MANRTKRTPQKDGKFFAALAKGIPVSTAAQSVGYGRTMVYEHREKDELFCERWDDAIAIAIERLEAEADRRAVEGIEDPVFYQGEQCGTVRKFSDTLLMFRLKALAPDRYRERAQIDHSGEINGRHTVVIKNFTGRKASDGND